MSIKLNDGTVLRNLEEQVQFLTNYHDVNQGIAQWGIRVVGTVASSSELPEPYDGEYGDTYAVGTKAPYFFYIWTRASIEGEPAYWFPFGEINIIGPEGPAGPKGPKGDTGESSKWYTNPTLYPENPQFKNGDMLLTTSSGIKGNVYRYIEGNPAGKKWFLMGNIVGPQGIQGVQGPKGERGPQGPQGQKGDTGDVGGFINIYGVVTSTSQLPNPDTLNNRTIAYLLGDSYPYDLYIQVGDADGPVNWVNSGPLNVSTLVTVNGQYQNVWDADVKADKADLNNYVKNTDYASANEAGVSKVDNKYGISVVDSGADKGKLILYGATAGDISNRSTYFRPITPGNMDLAVKDALCDGKGKEWHNSEQKAARERLGLSYLSEDKNLKFLDIGVPGILKRFFSDSLLMGDTHYGNGFIKTKSGGSLLFPDIGSNNETIPTHQTIENRFCIDYFDLGDGTSYRKSKIKLVPNSILVITENGDYRASAVGMVDNNGKLSKTDILPHEKTGSIGSKYYDTVTTAFIVTGYRNQIYSAAEKYCQVVRITINGLNTEIKFFSVKEVDGTVLTVSMKSSGTHRECISLGALLV